MSAAPRPVALITGASGGIGLELARLCAKGGHDVILRTVAAQGDGEDRRFQVGHRGAERQDRVEQLVEAAHVLAQQLLGVARERELAGGGDGRDRGEARARTVAAHFRCREDAVSVPSGQLRER